VGLAVSRPGADDDHLFFHGLFQQTVDPGPFQVNLVLPADGYVIANERRFRHFFPFMSLRLFQKLKFWNNPIYAFSYEIL
jgi:hypothetical protein